MKSQRTKPSPVTPGMSMDEWFFISGRPLIDLDSIGKSVRYYGCSESSGEPIRLRTGPRGVELADKLQRETIEAAPVLQSLDVRPPSCDPREHGRPKWRLDWYGAALLGILLLDLAFIVGLLLVVAGGVG